MMRPGTETVDVSSEFRIDYVEIGTSKKVGVWGPPGLMGRTWRTCERDRGAGNSLKFRFLEAQRGGTSWGEGAGDSVGCHKEMQQD